MCVCVQASGVWVGFETSGELLQVYPLRLLDRLWEAAGYEWNDTFLKNTTLEFDGRNELYVVSDFELPPISLVLLPPPPPQHTHTHTHTHKQVHNSTSTRLPLNLLLPNAVYLQSRPTLVQPPLSVVGSSHELSSALRHEQQWASFVPSTCPYTSAVVHAPACSATTRSTLVLVREGALSWKNEGSLYSRNCSVPAGQLPRIIFLGKSESYVFYVDLLIHPLLNGGCESNSKL